MRASSTQRKQVIETHRAELEEGHNTKTHGVASLQEKLKALDAEILELAPKTSQTAKDVLKLTDNDIATIRITARDPAMELRLLMELFCLFLDLPHAYERNGQKLLMDTNLLPSLVKRVSNCAVTTPFLDDTSKSLEHPEINAAKLESIRPALSILYDWVESGCLLPHLKDVGEHTDRIANISKEFASFNQEIALDVD
jgi:hypothetical protein